MKKSILFITFALTIVLSNTNASVLDWISCPTPTNVHKTGETASSISFDWNDCGCASSGYVVTCTRNGATETFSTSNSDFTFGNLTPGSYEFRFYTECGGVLSAPVIIEDILQQ